MEAPVPQPAEMGNDNLNPSKSSKEQRSLEIENLSAVMVFPTSKGYMHYSFLVKIKASNCPAYNMYFPESCEYCDYYLLCV